MQSEKPLACVARVILAQRGNDLVEPDEITVGEAADAVAAPAVSGQPLRG